VAVVAILDQPFCTCPTKLRDADDEANQTQNFSTMKGDLGFPPIKTSFSSELLTPTLTA
jgi:hypothetical protein